LDMLNKKIIMTGSNVVRHGRLKKLDRQDARKRPGGIVLRMFVCLFVWGLTALSAQIGYIAP